MGGRAVYGLLLDVVDISEMQKCRVYNLNFQEVDVLFRY